MDLAVYYTGSLLPFADYFASLFGKLWENQWGRECLLQLGQSLHCAPTLPFPYLRLLAARLDSTVLAATVRALLAALPKARSPRYGQVGCRHAHLVLESEFYSEYYLGLVEGRAAGAGSLFGEPLIEGEFVAVKGEHSRRLLVKLAASHCITNFTLRLERSEQACRLNYAVYAVSQEGKRRIGGGRIQEHQWAQLSREPYRQEGQERGSQLNVYGLEAAPVVAQYLEIELTFTESGIVSHHSEAGKVPQSDIIPELYGFPSGCEGRVEHLEATFSFNPEEMFFLSASVVGAHPLQKYSVSKGKQTECLYFRPLREDEAALRAKIEEKVERADFDAVPALQRKLVGSLRRFSSKVCLDYLYTALVVCLGELEQRGERLDEGTCNSLFEEVVRSSQGPVKASAFKAISKSIPLLIKSLQFVEEELASLGRLSFSYEELAACADLSNAELCQSLTGLILRAVDCQPQWSELLIRMAPKTQRHEEIVRYFLAGEDWLQHPAILAYVDEFPDAFFEGTFLPLLSYRQLCALAARRCPPARTELLLEVIVAQASAECQVELDVVGLIFRQEEVRWEQLEKVVTCCPQAVDTVVHQFMQADNCEALALQHYILLSTAAGPKYAEEFAQFLSRIYARSRTAFREVVLSLVGKCSLLHYDTLETLSAFIFAACDLGGIEGARLLAEDDLANLQVAVEALKVVERLPEGAELPN